MPRRGGNDEGGRNFAACDDDHMRSCRG
jgi:hypothetical protein